MWGWKILSERVETSFDLAHAHEVLSRDGFEAFDETEHVVFMKKKGTELTRDGKNYPIEVAVAKTDDGLLLQMRYDSFVLFDTGDLQRYMDTLLQSLKTG
jgi:hypothetical protein